MQVMIFTDPWHFSHSVVSMAKTRLSLLGQVMDACFSMGIRSSGAGVRCCLYPLLRLVGVIVIRYLLLGANTLWKRVRFTLGFGTNAAMRAIKSRGSNMPWVVPSRYGALGMTSSTRRAALSTIRRTPQQVQKPRSRRQRERSSPELLISKGITASAPRPHRLISGINVT